MRYFSLTRGKIVFHCQRFSFARKKKNCRIGIIKNKVIYHDYTSIFINEMSSITNFYFSVKEFSNFEYFPETFHLRKTPIFELFFDIIITEKKIV